MENTVFTVTQINNQLNSILKKHFKKIFIEGEISLFKVYPSGHAYFTLRDNNSEISCVYFNYTRNSSNIALENTKVTLSADLSMYVSKGKIQLYVDKIIHSGEGDLWLKYSELKKKLDKEGLFSLEHKKKLPLICNRIGLITSSKGAVVQDILNIINRRAPYLEIFFCDTIVQGENASKFIIESLKKLNSNKSLDLIIIARGGGSIEDLMCFNDELLVREIFNSCHPVISAIGHETDFTLCDFVSDKRASTPSEAAEICTLDLNSILINMNEILQHVYINIINEIDTKKNALNKYYYTTISKNPELRISEYKNNIDYFINNSSYYIMDKIKSYNNNILLNDKLLNNLNVKSIMKRGFGIIRKNNKIIKSVKNINKGDEVIFDLNDGSAKSKII